MSKYCRQAPSQRQLIVAQAVKFDIGVQVHMHPGRPAALDSQLEGWQ